MVSIIAALGNHRALGKNNRLLWSIPDDMKHFKQLTLGHPVVMGRKTFESILSTLGKPLPERTNIVITRQGVREGQTFPYMGRSDLPEPEYANSLEEGLALAKKIDPAEIFIIGGAQIYEQSLPYADRLYLTLIDDEKNADTFFPAYEKIFTKKISDESHEWNGLKYRWITLEK